MFTVALIGGDGAGKSTIAEKLEASSEFTAKTIYLGMSTQSSNFSLPTSKIVYFFKKKRYQTEVESTGKTPEDKIPAYYYENKNKKRSLIWVIGRFVNRLAELIYRQWIAWKYLRKGIVVIYDRHIIFESTPDVGTKHTKKSDGIFYWIVDHLFPKPDLSILLDAPAEVLYARKQESTLEHLSRRRLAYIEKGKNTKNFFIVDATQRPENVYKDVLHLILDYSSGHNISLQAQSL